MAITFSLKLPYADADCVSELTKAVGYNRPAAQVAEVDFCTALKHTESHPHTVFVHWQAYFD